MKKPAYFGAGVLYIEILLVLDLDACPGGMA
jgi:hypothetical protein